MIPASHRPYSRIFANKYTIDQGLHELDECSLHAGIDTHTDDPQQEHPQVAFGVSPTDAYRQAELICRYLSFTVAVILRFR